jgi:hypothetical protein
MGADGEEYSGLLAAKIKDIASATCRAEMDRCMLGNNNRNRLDNIEGEVDEMKETIADGFKEIKTIIETKQQQTRARWWDIAQIVITMTLTAIIAFKWH